MSDFQHVHREVIKIPREKPLKSQGKFSFNSDISRSLGVRFPVRARVRRLEICLDCGFDL